MPDITILDGYATNATTSGIGVLEVATDAQTQQGVTSSIPLAVTPSSLKFKLGDQYQYSVMLCDGPSNVLQASNIGTDGQVLIAKSSGHAQFASITAGSNITLTPGPNSLEIAASGGMPGGMTWVEISGSTKNPTVSGEGYFATNATSVTFTLPAAPSIGDTYKFANVSTAADGVIINYNASQYITFGNQTSTVTTGSLTSTAIGDIITITYFKSNQFIANAEQGNWTVV